MAMMAVTFLAQAVNPPAGLARSMGVDAGSGISYVLVSLDGKLVAASGSVSPPPRLTAVCTRVPGGKLKFELMADFGGVTEIAYYPPWKPASPRDLFPPRMEKAQVTMEFLGYTRVKPVKRSWEFLPTMPEELRYATPGIGSSNMEEIRYYMPHPSWQGFGRMGHINLAAARACRADVRGKRLITADC
jgi:hypothetical protein